MRLEMDKVYIEAVAMQMLQPLSTIQMDQEKAP